MTKQQQTVGKHGQLLAAAKLRMLGCEMVEKIGTPVIMIPKGTKNGVPVFQVIFEEKVSGDHRGILQNGISVLAETKTILDRNLRYSDLREHQPDRLSEHNSWGGLSLLVWVHSSGVYVMEWPIFQFVPGTSITPQQAEFVSIKDKIAS